MIAELGNYALMLALLIALVQASVPLAGARAGHEGAMALGVRAAIAQAGLVVFAFGGLMYAFIVSDFSVAVVAAHSHSTKPMLYKVAGVWGNHEGSMLLWVVILAIFGGAVALFGSNLPAPLRARVLAVQAMIGAGFLAFILLTSNPFARLDPAPLDGQGLNPLLQDPGLAFHPPFLYLGYVGFSMAYAFAVAALLEGRSADIAWAAWARWVRPWVLAAWIFLTIGIALGSFWAYYELGWGGWWFWDPVENASFMPWLVGTALLHSAIVVEKRQALQSWTILLAILTFSLSLVGTFLVRSGVLTSVHAFATDPARGVFILVLLTVATGGALLLYAVRAPRLGSGSVFAPVSREGSLVLNNMLLISAAATVFLGTFYPLAVDMLSYDKVSVGPPYFNLTFVPIMVPLVATMVFGALLRWRQDALAPVLKKLAPVLMVALAVFLAALFFAPVMSVPASFGLALAAWLIAGTAAAFAERVQVGRVPLAQSWRRARALPRASYGMLTAHAGVGVLIAGITVTTAWQQEHILVMRAGERVTVAGYEIMLQEVGPVPGPDYEAVRGVFGIARDGAPVAQMMPERRFYPVRAMETTEAAIRARLTSVLYLVLGAGSEDDGYTVRIYYHPLVMWIWGGALLMALGGFLSLSDRRHRVGAPRRKAGAVAATPAAPPAAAD